MTFQEQQKLLSDTIIANLCRITEYPENWLPHIVYVEEEGRKKEDGGYPRYVRYRLKAIYAETGDCLLENDQTAEEITCHLREICIDWLVTVWNRYAELCADQGMWKDHAVAILQQHTEAAEMDIREFVDEYWQNLLPDEENIAAFKQQSAPDENPLEQPLRRLLDIALLEIPCFEQSATYDICATAIDGLQKTEVQPSKQLYVFIWDCSHMPGDATQQEVVEAWKQGPTRSRLEDYEDDDTLYKVKRLTLEDYAQEHNSSDCAYGQCNIGFFYSDK